MKKQIPIRQLFACVTAASLAASPALSAVALRALAQEDPSAASSLASTGLTEEEEEEELSGKSGDGTVGTPSGEVPGKSGGEVPGKSGDGTVGTSSREVPGKSGGEVPGKSGDGTVGTSSGEVPGKSGGEAPETPVVTGSPETDNSAGTGSVSEDGTLPGKAGGASINAAPAAQENAAPAGTSSGETASSEMTTPAEASTEDTEDTGEEILEEEETDEESEEEEDSEEEEGEPEEEEEEELEEEEEPEAEKEPDDKLLYGENDDLTDEQRAILDDEDAAQAEQAFDYYEAYSPELFAYENYWRGWKQGQSAWYSMRNYGCRMTAYSKLLRASGVVKPGNFSPDDFFLWCRNNGWLLGTIREIGTPGNCMIAYAAEKGHTLIREERISMFKSADPEERKQEIIDRINEGYYVILCSSAHFVYVDELRTRITQELWVDDSINGENIYKVDRYVFQGSLADWENADPRKNWHYRCFKLEETEEDTMLPANTDYEDHLAEEAEYEVLPRVTDVDVSEYDEETGVYTIQATVNLPAGNLDRVMFPTWADNDHEDLAPDWEYTTDTCGTRVPGVSTVDSSVWQFRVDTAAHGGTPGAFFTYVYAYDTEGNRSAPYAFKVTVE